MRTRLDDTVRFTTFHPLVFTTALLALSGCSGQFFRCDSAGTCHEEALKGAGGSTESDGADAGGARRGSGGEPSSRGVEDTSGGASGDGGADVFDSGIRSDADSGTSKAPAPAADAGKRDTGPSDDATAALDGGCDATHLDCNQDPKDGCETDTASDDHHCGSCEGDCLGGVCSASTCSAVAIASGLAYPGQLAVDENYAFLMDGVFSTGRLVRTRLDGGQLTVLVSGLGLPSGLLSDGTRVFFASTGGTGTSILGPGVRSVTVTSPPTQTPVSIATRGTSPVVTTLVCLTTDAERVYWATIDGLVFSAPIAGGTPSAVNTSAVQTDFKVSGLEVDETNVYAAQGPTPWFVPRGGGAPTPIAIVSGNSAAIAIDEANLYFRYTDPRTEDMAIGRIPKGRSRFEDISTVVVADIADGALAVDGDTVYYPTTHGIYGVSKGGGKPTLLSTDVSHVAKIVPRVENGKKVLYWVNQGELTPPTGNVMRLAL